MVLTQTLRMAVPRDDMKSTGLRTCEWTRALFALTQHFERTAVSFARLTIAFHVALLVIAGVFGMWWLPIALAG